MESGSLLCLKPRAVIADAGVFISWVPNINAVRSPLSDGFGGWLNGGRMKRLRTPKAKDGELLVKYGKEYGDEDLFYCYPENECGMKRDSRLLSIAFERTVIFPEGGRTLRQELEARGYDITTLKFSVMKKTPNALANAQRTKSRNSDLHLKTADYWQHEAVKKIGLC